LTAAVLLLLVSDPPTGLLSGIAQPHSIRVALEPPDTVAVSGT